MFMEALQEAKSTVLRNSSSGIQPNKDDDENGNIKSIAAKIEHGSDLHQAYNIEALYNMYGGEVDKKYTTKFRSLLGWSF